MIEHSIILISYKRDLILKENISHIISNIKNSKYDMNKVEIILVDNNEDNIIRENLLKNFSNYKYIKLYKNIGVAGGRNEGIKKAKGKYITFIDDDAYIYPSKFLFEIENTFKNYKSIGAIAFKSINFYTRSIDKKEFPHTNKKINPNTRFYTFRFIGVAHSIKKEVFEKIGLYPYDYFYGMEEFDLSFRMINAGYKILYIPEVYVLHKKDPNGRLTDKHLWESVLLNKLKLNYKFLPLPYKYISSIIWILFVLLKSKGKANIYKVLKKYSNFKKNTFQNKLSKNSIIYIKKTCRGNLFK